MLLQYLIILLLLAVVLMLILNRSIKIEIKHFNETVMRHTYMDATPQPETPKGTEAPPDVNTEAALKEVADYYEKQKDPMAAIWDLVHDMREGADDRDK